MPILSFRRRCTVLIAMLLSACATQPPQRAPSSVESGHTITPNELAAIEASAAQGDALASFRLSLHFESSGQDALAARWLDEAATRGHPAAQYNRWFELRGRTDCPSMEVALYWLERAARSGSDSATRNLPVFKGQVEHCLPEGGH